MPDEKSIDVRPRPARPPAAKAAPEAKPVPAREAIPPAKAAKPAPLGAADRAALLGYHASAEAAIAALEPRGKVEGVVVKRWRASDPERVKAGLEAPDGAPAACAAVTREGEKFAVEESAIPGYWRNARKVCG